MQQGSTLRSAPGSDGRFAFGDNWRSFLDELEESRIIEAERSLQWLLGCERLDGRSFLDIGSGSGLSSLAARRLGARVFSFDYDAQSVECTRLLRDRFFPGDASWTVEQGSVLDPDYLGKLGAHDIVYSWGVLHHTGAMREAVERASRLVAPSGTFVFALYRKTRMCPLWALEKRWYCRASASAQAFIRRLYVGSMRMAFTLLGRDFNGYVANYKSGRGMNFQHDVHDWLGGFPYESIRPAEVEHVMGRLGFAPVRSKVQPYSTGLFGSGCDEYVYCRTEPGHRAQGRMGTNIDNLDDETVRDFGREWRRFDQSRLPGQEHIRSFQEYFAIFPWDSLSRDAVGFDAGCGSGRWAALVAPRVGRLHCIDASADALAVARRNLEGQDNISFHAASISAIPLPDDSMDFGYSLGVLHHMPDPARGLAACVRKLKPGGFMLIYVYYALDNKPAWFRSLWQATDYVRQALSRMPFRLKAFVADIVAALVYWPLARSAQLAEWLGFDVSTWPLGAYNWRSYYSMRTDALDRLGTRVEHRMTRANIQAMMEAAGLMDIRFSERVPFWCAVGRKN